MTYPSTTTSYSFVTSGGASNDIIGPENLSVSGELMSGGGKRAKSPKKSKKKKATKKRVAKTPMRKPVAKRTQRMARMRLKSTIAVEKRKKKLSKRLKHRKARTDVINSLASNTPISKESLDSLSPEMKKFVSKIPKDKSRKSQLSSWPDIDDISIPGSISDISFKTLKSPSMPKSKSSRQIKFEEARKGLENILKKKPIYGTKSKSIVKFSDYKKVPTKEMSELRSKSKRKGHTR